MGDLPGRAAPMGRGRGCAAFAGRRSGPGGGLHLGATIRVADVADVGHRQSAGESDASRDGGSGSQFAAGEPTGAYCRRNSSGRARAARARARAGAAAARPAAPARPARTPGA
ncbi:hypothetical protein, partial [uncultured Arthrobacter sp.]|uniref:hypothetical protein n=1 Tax=uncultured Arthrobacter sp. TaxID=114050 RepID=UPI003217AF2C